MATVSFVAALASLVQIIGGWLTLRFTALVGEMEQVMALGAGLLLGTALMAMVPAATRAPGGAAALTVGFALFLVLRLFMGDGQSPGANKRRGLMVGRGSAMAVLAAMTFHSLMEGVAIGLAAQAGGTVSWLAISALMLHKVPEGVSLAAVFWTATGSARLAMLAVTAAGVATLAGGWAGLLGARLAVPSQGAVLGIAAGGFLYVGATEMLPQVIRRRGSLWLVLLGMTLVYLIIGSADTGHLH